MLHRKGREGSMALRLGDIEGWLPPEFLAEEELLMETTKATTGDEISPSLSSCFPTEFPYEFDSVLTSPVESVAGSIEDEDEDEQEEDAFLAGLTRRLSRQQLAAKSEKKWTVAGSPESTLCGMGSCWSVSSNGSPNGGPSPPTTPFAGKDDTWERIYAAAGQVARLKMMTQAQGLCPTTDTTSATKGTLLRDLGPRNVQNPNPNPAWFSSVQSIPLNASSQLYQSHDQLVGQLQQQDQLLKTHYTSLWGKQQHYQVKPTWQQPQQIPSKEGRNLAYDQGRYVRPLGLPPSAWPPLQVQQPNQLSQHQPINHSTSSGMKAVFLGGSATGVKRECAGTGVFLPRRYGNNPSADSSTKKKTGGSTVLLPAKVVQALSLNFDDRNMECHTPPRFNSAFRIPDYDVIMARRNAILAQRKRSLRPEGLINHEVRLPQEWTY